MPLSSLLHRYHLIVYGGAVVVLGQIVDCITRANEENVPKCVNNIICDNLRSKIHFGHLQTRKLNNNKKKNLFVKIN